MNNGSGYPIPPNGTDGLHGRPYWIDAQAKCLTKPPQSGLGLGSAIQKIWLGPQMAKYEGEVVLEDISFEWGTIPKSLPADKEELKQQLEQYQFPLRNKIKRKIPNKPKNCKKVC